MRTRQLIPAFLLAALAVPVIRIHSQANVNENQSTFLYVDAQNGSDSSSGSSYSPLRTIQAAVNMANANNQQSIGTKIIVNSGVYREAVYINPISRQTSVPLTIEAASEGGAVIAASEVLNNWSPDSSNSSVYSSPWSYSVGACSVPNGWPTNFAPIALQREMIFVDGTPLTQVLSHANLRAGTFYVDQSSGVIYVWPASGTNMQSAVVEAAVRSKTLSVVGRTNVVLRGLVFRQAANCINTSGATVTRSSNVLIDSVQALWNNWGGISVSSSNNVTVQNSIASYNGGVGLQGSKLQNALYDSNETDYNNWRGAQAAFYEWGMGGAKFFDTRSITVHNHFSYNNQGEGLWFDTDNKDITIDNATLAGNVTAALQIERNEGPITLKNSNLCTSGVGLNVLTSERLTVKNNIFYNNGGTNKYQAEIYIAGQAGGKQITDFLTRAVYDLFTTGMVMTGNTFQDAASGQNVFGTYLSGSDWSDFANTLNASNNQWYSPITTNAFKIANGKFVNLSGWQGATGTDYSSYWSPAPASQFAACAVPAASYNDFSVNLNNRNFTMTDGTAVATVRVNSFGSGPVTLTATGMPSGVTASISDTSMVSGVATLTLSATKTAAWQTVPITLWATGNGRVHSVTIDVTVVPAS
jgi:hypothetical protein